jgi:type II secretory pathway pseudopilin PulG
MTQRERAFSLVEALVLMGALAATTGVGLVAVTQTREASQRQKLESDVGRLNNAVKAYQMNGGVIPDEATAAQVLTRLKTNPSAQTAKAVVGVAGPFIDERIQGVESTAATGPWRATWNTETQRFEVSTSGVGYREFRLDGSGEMATTETRSTSQKFAVTDAWVWDYEGADAVETPPAPRDLMTASVEIEAPVLQGNAGPRRLLQPEFSRPTGLYPYADFPMGVTLTNPNPPGSSQIYYSLNNGPWVPYSDGAELALPTGVLTSSLRTYAAAYHTESWNDSGSAENLYKTIFFRGETNGVFHSPVGESTLVTNLTTGLSSPTFKWGKIASGYTQSNSMVFTPASNYTVVPDQEFKVGDLYYYNGTVVSGTSATGVKLRVGLNFTVPERVETFEFDFRLYSTPNKGVSADEDADFVWIPSLASQFTAQVQGQTFYLQLRFGNSTANGFTTIDEFHVHENKSATGAIYGKFTTNPVF